MAPTPTMLPGRELSEMDVGRLRAEVQCVARRELREDEATRREALRQFRDWLAKNRDVQHCRTDSNFLLRFLRAKKFSVPMAQQMLLKYLNLRQCFSHLMMKLDPAEPVVAELIASGYIFVSPFKDAVGRRVVIYVARKVDARRHTRSHMAQAQMLTLEALLEDEESQVLGVVHVVDLSQLGPAHITMWPITEFATVVKWGEQSVPMRHKQVHVLNMPTPLRYVYEFAQSRVSEKMRSRFVIHDSLSHLHSTLDPKVLPKEYGGRMAMAEMIDLWQNELKSKRERLLALDDMRLLSASGIMTRHSQPADSAVGLVELAGSFRQLEVD